MMLSGKNDPFLAVFEVCQSLLLGSKSVDNDAEVDRLDRILAAVTEKQLHQSALSRLQSVREYRQRTMQHLSSRRSVESLTIRAIESNYFQAEAVCLRHKEVTKRRLDQQVQCAERRMRELVFEIIGEYGKSEVRIERRRMFLLNAARLKFITRVFQLRWQRFSLLLCDEMNAQRLLCNENSEYIEGSLEKTKGRVLCHPIDGAEISSVTASIGNIIKKHALQISPNIKVLGIVKLYRHQQLQKGRSRLNSITGPSDVINSAPSQGGNVTHPGLGTSDIRLSLTNRAAPKLCGGSDSYLITSPAQFQSAVDRLTHWSEEEPSRRSALQKAGNGPDKTPQIRSCQLLSNHSIAWLHPPSFYPGIWGKIHNCDRQSTQHRELLNVRDKVCPESKRSRELPREDFLNDFMTKYTQQHTALVASDSIYFCLEERSLSANHAGERDDNVSTKPSREQLTLYVNDQLQSIYCPSLHGRNLDLSSGLEVLRNVLISEPLHVEQYLHNHHDEDVQDTSTAAAGLGSHSANRVAALMTAFPDIIKVSTLNEESLHFAPACCLNLIETGGFSDAFHDKCRPSSDGDDRHFRGAQSMEGRADVEDWLAQIAQTIPYPHMRECSSSAEGEGLFAGSSNGSRKFILDRLFCLVNVPSLPDFESIVTGIEPTDHLPATGAVVTDRGMVADGKNPFQIMIPLSDPCMRELLATILPKSSENSTRSQCGLRAIDLLPDHARYRYSEYPSPSPSERVDDSNGKCSHDKCTDSLINGVTGNDGESVHMLRHKYFLLPGTELLDGVDSDRGNRLELNSQGGSSDCFYFVQLDDGDNEDSSSKIDQSSSHSCCLEEDDNTLRQLLRSIPPSKIDVASTQTNASRTHDGLPDYQHGTFKERAENGSDNGPSANGVVQGSPSAPKKWDISVLSTICRWRSCLCEGGKTSPYLCTYHNELKSFLDIKSSSSAQSDASKYLPRKSPAIGQSNTPSGHNLGLAATAAAESRMDLTTIRAASTLLQELWDGKLKSTLRSFVKKTTHDMRLKKRLQAASAKGMLSHEKYLASCVPNKAVGAGATAISRVGGENGRIRKVSVTSTTLKNLPLPKPPGDSTPNKPKPSKVPGPNTGFSLSIMAMPALPESPQWSVWKDRDLFNKTAGGATEATRLLSNIFETEKMITRELKLLSDLKVFPSQELLLVRKDVKGLKDKAALSKEEKLGNERERLQNTRSREEPVKIVKITKKIPEYEEIIEVSAMEQLVTERKLSLFVERRKDEQEAKIHKSRKNAKTRAIQEVQSRDPSNFTNQKKF